MSLSQTRDTPLFYGQELCEVLFRSNSAVKSYGPHTNFGYVTAVTSTLEIWPLAKVITQPWVIDNDLYEILSRSNMTIRPGHGFWLCKQWPQSQRYDFGSRSWNTLWSWTTIPFLLCQILSRLDKGMRQAFWVCVHYHLDLGYMTLAKVITHPLVMDKGQFCYLYTMGSIFRDMTLGQGHVTLLGHGQQLCQILSRSNKGIRKLF